ncbi:MAG: carbohydrate ABC transporter permease [Nitrososphaeria archaeon]
MRDKEKIVIYTLVIILLLYIFVPFGFMVLTSFKEERDVMTFPFQFFPKHGFSMINWNYIIFGGKLPPELGYEWAAPGGYLDVQKGLINSLIVATFTVILNLSISIFAGYSLSRVRGIPKREGIFVGLLAMKMVPVATIIIPLYIIMKEIGLLNTYLSLILSFSAVQMPLSVWILRGFFENLPMEIEESAWIDGASRVQTIIRIILPLAFPGVGAVAVYSFLGAWGEFFIALILTSHPDVRPFTVTLSQFALEDNMTYSILCTVGVISVVPSVIIAILFQKLLIQGLTAGAVKR